MKNLLVKIVGSAMVLFLFTGLSFAQETGTGNKSKNQEKTMVKEQNQAGELNQVNQQYRERFRASLTQEQKDILENREMNQNEKKKAFKNSLNEQQRTMLRENEQLRKEQKNMFKNSASEEQKQQMRQNKENTRTQAGKQGQGK